MSGKWELGHVMAPRGRKYVQFRGGVESEQNLVLETVDVVE